MLHGINSEMSAQEEMIHGVKKNLSLTTRYVISGQYGLVCYNKAIYMGSKRILLIRVNSDLSVTRRHVIWGQRTCLFQEGTLYRVKKTCLLEEGTLYGVKRTYVLEEGTL